MVLKSEYDLRKSSWHYRFLLIKLYRIVKTFQYIRGNMSQIHDVPTLMDPL